MTKFAIILCTVMCAAAASSKVVVNSQLRRDAMSDIMNQMKERRIKEKREIDDLLENSMAEFKGITESITVITKSLDKNVIDEIASINNTVTSELEKAKLAIKNVASEYEGEIADECKELEGVNDITAVSIVTYANGCILNISTQSTSNTEHIRQRLHAAMKKFTNMRQESSSCIEKIYEDKVGFKDIFEARECLRSVKYAVDAATTDSVSGFSHEITKFKEDMDNLRNALKVCGDRHGVSTIRETFADITSALSICLTGYAEV